MVTRMMVAAAALVDDDDVVEGSRCQECWISDSNTGGTTRIYTRRS